MRILLFVFALLFNCFVLSEQINSNSQGVSGSEITVQPIKPTTHIIVSTVESPVNYDNKQTANKEQKENCLEKWFWKFIEDPIAVFTCVLSIVTFLLWWSTRALALDAKDASKRQSRAFVFIDGFNVELTTAADGKKISEPLPELYKDRPELYITRFAVQPKWKNSGNTPAKNMNIKVNWCSSDGITCPEYTYKHDPQKIFLSPNSTESGSVIEIPPIQRLIDYGFNPTENEPKIFIWGTASYEDIFG